MMTQPKNIQSFIIGVLSTLVLVLGGWVGYDTLFKANLQTTVVAQTVESSAVSEPIHEVNESDLTATTNIEQAAFKSQHRFKQLNGNILQGSATGEVYPELGFPDFSSQAYKKFTQTELLSQIDAEYHEGLEMTDDPAAYGLEAMNQAPTQMKKISASIQTNLPAFVNQVFERPSESDVAVAMDGWIDLGEEGYLYRALVTSARYQCTWYQAVISQKTGKQIYEEFIPCYQPNQREI